MSQHYSEDDLILYYYGERRRDRAMRTHLDGCQQCASAYRDLSTTLSTIETPTPPERGEQYGLEVWQRIRHQLPEQDLPWWVAWFAVDRLVLAGSFSVLLVAAFLAGRLWGSKASAPAERAATNATLPLDGSAADDTVRQRILLTTVADHLDRSERVLTEVMNTRAGGDISSEQRWAEDLIDASRLYRQDAADVGEHSVAVVLDELERSLLEIVHSPSTTTAATLDQLRQRIDAASLLFKIRVLGDELRQREQQPTTRPRTLAGQTS